MSRLLTIALLATTGLTAAACGGSSSNGEGSPSSDTGEGSGEARVVQVDVEAGTLNFEETEVSTEAGPLTLRSTNPDAIEHNIAIEGNGVSEEGELVSNGDTSEITVELEPGEYELYCTPHREAGMTATLTVT